jgi:Asp-tRNA(Asn)/Glu-tRNA(Gln) amidotransferase A subunit family amidase
MSMKTISELRAAFLAGTYTPTEAIVESLKMISEKNDDINAFLDVYEDAKEAATAATEAYKRGGELPPLLGVPVAIKHNILIKGKRATASSRIIQPPTMRPSSNDSATPALSSLVVPTWTNLQWGAQLRTLLLE